MHIILTSIDQLSNLKRHDSFEATCGKCGASYTVTDFRPERMDRYKHILCQPCYAKKLKEERYGDPNYNNRNKAKETCLEVYGCENVHQNEQVKKKAEQTCLEIYGSTNPNGNKQVREKITKTCIERYGTACSLRNEEISEKVKKTMNERYGVTYTAESEELRNKMNQTRQERYGNPGYTNREKAKETMLELYGVENPTQLKEFQDRIKETRYNRFGAYNNMPKLVSTVRERYGVDCVFQNGYVSDKAKETMLNKYGNEVYFRSDHYQQHKSEYVEKMAKTMNERYGVNCFTKCDSYKEMMNELRELHPEIFQCATRFVCNGLTFDSIPEYCVYTYCIYNWIPIVRNYTIRFEYTDIKGKTRHVCPDFIINGQLVEIKGGHFFKDDDTMYLPFRDPEWSDEEYEYRSSVYESKRQCLIKNNVLILKDTDPWVQNCVEFVKQLLDISLFMKNNLDNICYGYTPYNCDMSKEYAEPIGIGRTPFSA